MSISFNPAALEELAAGRVPDIHPAGPRTSGERNQPPAIARESEGIDKGRGIIWIQYLNGKGAPLLSGCRFPEMKKAVTAAGSHQFAVG